jgi:hypothetical protein
MTVADTIYDNINDNWGNGGYAGDTPKKYSTEATKSIDWTSADVIIVNHWNVRERPKPVNDTYTDRTYFVEVYIQSKTSAAQLKLLVDEVEYLLRNETMTSLEFVNNTKDYSATDKSEGRHACNMTVEVISRMASGAITPAASSTGDFNVGGDLTVTGNDIKDSGGNTCISFDGSGAIDALALGDSLTLAYLKDLLMWGSANAAWVPLIPVGGNSFSHHRVIYGYITNLGADNLYLSFLLPIPTVKGSLKLYVDDVRYEIDDADADDYVTAIYMYGWDGSSRGTIDSDTTDQTSAGTITWSRSATDVSSYESIWVQIETVNTNASDLDLTSFQILCYYST